MQMDFVFLGILISSIGYMGYLIATLKGKVKPNRVSYLMWSIAPIITFSAQINQGVGLESYMTISIGILPFLIFLASYVNKKAEWKLTLFDFLCGLLSIIGLFLWIVTNDGKIAILFSIIADFLAAIPTLVKAFRFPDTEIAWPCLTSALGVMLTFLTIQQVTFTNASFIIYIFILNMMIFSLVQFRLGKKLAFSKIKS